MMRIMVQWVQSKWLGVVVAALLLMQVPVAAQGPNTLRGRVVDELARPVSFAQIEVRPANRRLIADANGEFTITALADGDYEVRVRRIGYSPANVALRIPHNEAVLLITMASLPQVLDSVRPQAQG